MRERVTRLLEGQRLESAPLVSTFHSLCVRMLRRDIEKLEEGYTRSFTIYDQDDSPRVVKACIKDLGYDDQRLGARQTQSAISHAKNSGLDAETYAARAESHDEKRAAIARVFKLYEERLVNNNALDFDDLMIKAVRLLRKREDVRAHYNDRFRYILVDEYQDTNALQFALIHFLTQKQQNICVVGDESQSIYRWRGADISNILNFEQHYPEARTIKLEQNYRSTQTILDAADAVIKHNTERKEKTLWTANPAGAPIRYYQAMDAEGEARFVAAKIEEHRRLDRESRAAILYRTNAQSRVFEEALRRAGLAYNIVGGFSFYERAEVRDIVSYLKLALNPHDSIALHARHQHADARARQADARRARPARERLRRLALGGHRHHHASSPRASARAPSRRSRSFRRSSKGSSRARRRSRPPKSSRRRSSTRATPTRSRPRTPKRPRGVLRTCRSSSTRPSITTRRRAAACATS